MFKSSYATSALTKLTLFIAIIGLVGQAGVVAAAERTVVGELWSQDG